MAKKDGTDNDTFTPQIENDGDQSNQGKADDSFVAGETAAPFFVVGPGDTIETILHQYANFSEENREALYHHIMGLNPDFNGQTFTIGQRIILK